MPLRSGIKRDKARIIPTGEYALHALGLSTQMPMIMVYLTDGAPRKIQVGKQTIVFKKTSPKIISLFQKEEPRRLEYDIRLAPEWIRKIIRESLSKRKGG